MQADRRGRVGNEAVGARRQRGARALALLVGVAAVSLLGACGDGGSDTAGGLAAGATSTTSTTTAPQQDGTTVTPATPAPAALVSLDEYATRYCETIAALGPALTDTSALDAALAAAPASEAEAERLIADAGAKVAATIDAVSTFRTALAGLVPDVAGGEGFADAIGAEADATLAFLAEGQSMVLALDPAAVAADPTELRDTVQGILDYEAPAQPGMDVDAILGALTEHPVCVEALGITVETHFEPIGDSL